MPDCLLQVIEWSGLSSYTRQHHQASRLTLSAATAQGGGAEKQPQLARRSRVAASDGGASPRCPTMGPEEIIIGSGPATLVPSSAGAGRGARGLINMTSVLSAAVSSLASPHILVVEDDPASRSLLVSHFENEGYRLSETDQAEHALSLIEHEDIDLVLLDIRLPGKDGLTLTRELRALSDIGIILVTAKGDEIDRIVGLELGADDYVTKPFNPRELLVRAKNLLRRIEGTRSMNPRPAQEGCCQFEGWTLDAYKRVLMTPEGDQERLPQGEFKLLQTLIRHAGQVLSRDQLMDAIHDRDWMPNDRSVDVLVGRLRRKLRENPSDPRFILTAHGAGYFFAGKLG